MTRAHDGVSARSELALSLGPSRWAALQEVLICRTATWAAEVAPGGVHVAYEPTDGGPRLRALLGPGVHAFGQNGAGPGGRVANAAARAFASDHGPVLTVWPGLPSWRAEHATGAIGDLHDGCGVSLGPVFDGGFYLVALARPAPPMLGLLAIAAQTAGSPDGLGTALVAAHASGLAVGLLRAERGLHSLEDARAALADPLLDPELRRLLDHPSAAA